MGPVRDVQVTGVFVTTYVEAGLFPQPLGRKSGKFSTTPEQKSARFPIADRLRLSYTLPGRGLVS